MFNKCSTNTNRNKIEMQTAGGCRALCRKKKREPSLLNVLFQVDGTSKDLHYYATLGLKASPCSSTTTFSICSTLHTWPVPLAAYMASFRLPFLNSYRNAPCAQSSTWCIPTFPHGELHAAAWYVRHQLSKPGVASLPCLTCHEASEL